MNFEDFKLFYAISCLGLGLIILSPTLALVIRLPSGESFSELWILGSGHLAEDYPFNVLEGQAYKVYLGIGNHMGDLEYYSVYVKLRNQTEPLPDVLNGTPSTLSPLVEYRMFLRDNETWEKELLFSFEGVSFQGNVCKISRVVVDGYALSVDKNTVWNEESNGFYFQLFFELWRYNSTSTCLQYHNRFVGIWLNMTESV